VGTLLVTGLYKGEIVSTSIDLDQTFAEYAGTQLFDSVTAADLTGKTGGAASSFKLKLLKRYEEFHDVERQGVLYTANRPIVITDELAEGGPTGGYSPLVADTTYASENADGRLVRIGSRGIESSFLGPDYPDDYYFRFPGGMTRDGGSFLSGRRSVRWRGTAGYEGDKLRSGIPGDVKSLFAKLLQKDYREWTFEEVELSSQSDSGGTRSKKAPFDWEAEIEPFVNRQRSLSLSASVDLS